MSDKYLLACMYEFYNDIILRGQNEDIDYYIRRVKELNPKNILVVGAGTGRVAIPLASYCDVTALDFDKERLDILKEKNDKVKIICSDFLKYDFENTFELIIVPYSTIQFNSNKTIMKKFINKLCKVMDENSIMIFDVSNSFNQKIKETNLFLFKSYCKKIDDNVSVYYTSKKNATNVEFIVRYEVEKMKKSVVECERYYYYNEAQIEELVEKNQLQILRIDKGYIRYGSDHKFLYNCRRKS